MNEPYRGAGGGSSTLAALAAEGAAAIPRQSKLLTPEQIQERLELATGVERVRGGMWWGMGAALAGLFGMRVCVADDGTAGAAVGISIGVAAVFGIAAVMTSGRAATKRSDAIAKLLQWPSSLPFPADGFDEFLIADRPLVDVVLAVEPERRMFIDAVHAVDAAIEVQPIGDGRFRLALPARSKSFTSKHSARIVRFGDRELLARLFDRLILPLHVESGVAAVQFGGTIEERN